MPIRPENKARYPKDWKRIADAIRERAGDRCEGSPAYPDCRAENRVPHPETGSMVVLTVAHLDHTPENCDSANLRAMCQRCHLTYDADHHRKTAYATRKAAANTGDLFAQPARFARCASNSLAPLQPGGRNPIPSNSTELEPPQPRKDDHEQPASIPRRHLQPVA